ncbi:sigma-70 family RNA polymerase sigma factor [Phenylobacterium sp.]|uniref:sigma-70 family RNA polymerase sigma factor n=1 Tax=Phenylobacterium sp. TaxID=1871053 RepID=UPI0035B0C68A
MHDDDFKTELTGLIPSMRAFARSLSHNPAEADDLAQDALLKAWSHRDSYTPGTNMKAWVFMILRNQFYSERRRAWRRQDLDPEVAERTLIAVSNPDGGLALDEVRRALAMLPDDQREALILIGAGGLSYDEAAQITGAAVGTVKSRVSRARDRLARILHDGDYGEDDVAPHRAMAIILAEMDRLSGLAA